MSTLDKLKLIPGQRYLITMNDCCVQGRLLAVFVGYSYYEEEDEDEAPLDTPEAAVFDVAIIGPIWGRWEVELIDDEATATGRDQ